MISLERCRKILGSSDKSSADDLATLRDQFYCLASVTLEGWDHQRKTLLHSADGLIDRDALEERAAIVEFEGNLSREEAESNAVGLALENAHVN